LLITLGIWLLRWLIPLLLGWPHWRAKRTGCKRSNPCWSGGKATG
jgi:hypothetical protein